ncbi:MAG TPA: pseudouridine synthase [Pirellulales bacterium]
MKDIEGVRLQKVLAAAGVGSRRHCEELIQQGRVDVDGKTVSELGTRVDPLRQKIRVDGEPVRQPKRKLYYLINKPSGILSTSHDPAGRMRVIDLAPSQQRLFTIGRLDKSSSGLILVTNDGVLTDLLTHPRYGVEKTYLAQVVGVPSPEALAKLQRGVHLAEGFAHAKRAMVRRTHRQSTLLEIVLDEGRNREVRRLLARIGHKVLALRRIAIGPLRLGNLQPGESRPLGKDEVEELYQDARTRRKKSGQTHDKPGKLKALAPGKKRSQDRTENDSGVQPIIDHSLPLELSEGEAMIDADFMLAENFELPASEREQDTAPVDLSPLTRDSRRRQTRPTIIGAKENRAGGKQDQPKHRRSARRPNQKRHRKRGDKS